MPKAVIEPEVVMVVILVVGIVVRVSVWEGTEQFAAMDKLVFQVSDSQHLPTDSQIHMAREDKVPAARFDMDIVFYPL